MTQPPYGQQPGNYGQQSGGYPQQSGGYPQQQGGYPQQGGGYPSPPSGFPQPSGGYPQAPDYSTSPGGLPQAPPDYGSAGPVARPGSATAAAVLGFVQGGITTITTLLLFLGLASAADSAVASSDLAIAWAIAIGQLAGIILLIWGGVQLMSGSGRTIFLVGAGLEIVLAIVWLIRFVSADNGGLQAVKDVQSFGVLLAILFAAMPAIGLILAMGGATTQYVQSRRA